MKRKAQLKQITAKKHAAKLTKLCKKTMSLQIALIHPSAPKKKGLSLQCISLREEVGAVVLCLSKSLDDFAVKIHQSMNKRVFNGKHGEGVQSLLSHRVSCEWLNPFVWPQTFNFEFIFQRQCTKLHPQQLVYIIHCRLN